MAKLNFSITPKFLRPEILMHPQIPKPMHGTAPRTVLGQSWWDIQRRSAYTINNFCCWACGVHRSKAKYNQWLEGHESYTIDYKKGLMTLVEIIALCHCCHNYIHKGRLEHLLEKDEISIKKYTTIIDHGNAIKRNVPIKLPTVIQQDFSAWRLVINGIHYKGQFKTYREWEQHYE